MQIAQISPTSPDLIALLEAQDAEYASIYPPELNFTVPIDDLDRPDLTFLALRHGDRLCAFGGILFAGNIAEMKRVYVDPAARGRGFAQQIVNALEREAASKGHMRVLLETGEETPGAIKLYEKLGYQRRGPFGDYAANASSVFMEKAL